jgi:deoxyribonuclease V
LLPATFIASIISSVKAERLHSWQVSHAEVLDTPTAGCAKSRSCGRHEMPSEEPSSYAEVIDKGETIGVALRTRFGVHPVYVSIGYKVDLNTAIYWVMNCCCGYRLPEPTRLVHLAAGGNLK